jgi:hypothetical protein
VADDDTTELTRALAEQSSITTLIGKMVRLEGVRAIVDVGGGRIPVTLIGGRIPRGNEDVHVWFLNGKSFLMGVSTPQPTQGVIATTGADVVAVTTDQGNFEGVPYLGEQPSSGDIVALAWGEGGPVVTGISSLTPDDPVTPPDQPASASQRVDTFTATGSGSAANGRSFGNVNDVYASASQIGVFTYGSKLRDSLAGAVSIDKVEIFLTAKRDSGNLPQLGTHPLEQVSGVTPTISNLRPISRPFSRWVDITDLAKTLAAGGGVGFDGAGYAVFAGINSDPTQAGALRVTYTK